MRNTYGFFILLLSLFLGEIASRLLPLGIPGAIWGMAIFLMTLISGFVQEDTVKVVCDFLLAHMNLFFAPGAVNLIVVYPALRGQILKILFVTVISTMLVIISAGHTAQFLARRQEAKRA